MTTQKDFARRKARGGKGLIPPNPKQWSNEHNGLDLRDDLSVALDVALPHLDAFELLENVTVIPHGEIPCAAKYHEHFRGHARWSGMALAVGEHTLVVYNDSHPSTRTRSTLMEEFFHLRLGHRPSTLKPRIHTDSSRTYDRKIEDEAFGSGAAALVPYKSLRALLGDGASIGDLASRFQVSEALITFRMKVTKLYRRHSRGAT